MKLLIILSILAYGYGDKLDRTYLPPPNAGTAGGSPGSITAPGSSSGDLGRGQQSTTFGKKPSGQQLFGQGSVQGFRPVGQQNSYNIDTSRPTGSFGLNQPSPVYGPASGRTPTGSNEFQQGGNTASGFLPNKPSNVNTGSGPAQSNVPSYEQQQTNSGFRQQGGFPQGKVQGSSSFASQPSQAERAQAAADRNAEILRYTNENDSERFSYSFETSNGISAEESGVATNGVQAQGGYSYTGDDGKAYTVTYTADENGYQPQGEHLPTPPPIPEEILKSIEKNAQAAATGTQEGAYRPEEYENEGNVQTQRQGQGSSQQYGAPVIGRPANDGEGFQQQNNQGPLTQSFGKPSGSGQFNKPSLTDALNQALNQQQPSKPVVDSKATSGYQYNGPLNNQYNSGSVNQDSSRRQSNAQPTPTGNAFRPAGPSAQNSQFQSGSLGSNRGPQSQGSKYQTGSNLGQYQPENQGYSYQSPSKPGQFQPGSNLNLNRPQGQYQPGSNRPVNQQNQPGSFNQLQSGSLNRAQNQPQYQPNHSTGYFDRQGSQNRPENFGNQSPQGQSQYQPGRNQGAISGNQGQAPYQYNKPSQGLPSQGPQGPQGFQGQNLQTGFNKPSSGQPGSNSEQFGGPRQPPSFNPQDGYTY